MPSLLLFVSAGYLRMYALVGGRSMSQSYQSIIYSDGSSFTLFVLILSTEYQLVIAGPVRYSAFRNECFVTLDSMKLEGIWFEGMT